MEDRGLENLKYHSHSPFWSRMGKILIVVSSTIITLTLILLYKDHPRVSFKRTNTIQVELNMQNPSNEIAQNKRDSSTEKPIHYWAFEETTKINGTILDSGSEPSNGINRGATIQEGIKGQSLYFNGSAYVKIPLKASMLGSTFTIASWVKFDKPEHGDWTGWITHHKAFTNRNTFFFGRGPGGNNFGITLFSNDGVNNSLSTPFSPLGDIWYYVVAVFTGSDLKLFVNSKLIGSITFTGEKWDPSNNTFDLLLGGGEWSLKMEPDHLHQGWIDEVKIWPTALSPTQIHDEFFSTFNTPILQEK